jgi:hypothetical protein
MPHDSATRRNAPSPSGTAVPFPFHRCAETSAKNVGAASRSLEKTYACALFLNGIQIAFA